MAERRERLAENGQSLFVYSSGVLASEVIIHDAFGIYAKGVEHRDDGL